MTLFAVYEGSNSVVHKPAILVNGPICWRNNVFFTLEQAQKYANEWLGPHAPDRLLELNEKYAYSGYGDYVIITTIK